MNFPSKIRVIDSHTGGEPTRLVIEGAPDLGGGSMAQRLEVFRRQHDHFRSAVACEPRGHDGTVGALLCEPVDPTCACGVIFFNSLGYLGMCGHGTIGLAVTLAHMGRMKPGRHRIETPVGIVTVELHDDHHVTVWNIPSYRAAAKVRVQVDPFGHFTGDIAWGGNWFFLVEKHGRELVLEKADELTELCVKIRRSLRHQQILAPDGQEIDHIELFGPAVAPGANSRNFVLCSSNAFDRSPCGTGTSAKVACLIADGKLQEGQTWRQESIVGSIFEASGRRDAEGRVLPQIKGSAYVCAEATLIRNPQDPFASGIRR